MPTMPKTTVPDATIDFLRHGYEAIGRRCDRLGSDVFQTRLLLRRTICMRGEEAASVFYDRSRFTREGAAPRRVRKTLFGEGGVQSLDGERHAERKQLFLSLVSPDLVDLLEDHWMRVEAELLFAWARSREPIVLLSSLEHGLMRATCRWLGLPLQPSEEALRTADVVSMIEGAAAFDARYLVGRVGRMRAEAWIKSLIDRVRSTAFVDDTPLAVIANYRDSTGAGLDAGTAAVELLNLLRPIVAVSRFGMFAALALHEQPELRETLQDDAAGARFVDEVRRFYPFFPFVAARVRDPFEWRGMHFPAGRLTLLDLYGTNHEAAAWGDPEAFRPDRFLSRPPQAFQPIPQGGGDVAVNHRCPGEDIARRLTLSVARLLSRIDYRVPPQDLRVRKNRMPARVESGFVMENIRWRTGVMAHQPRDRSPSQRTDAVYRVVYNVAVGK